LFICDFEEEKGSKVGASPRTMVPVNEIFHPGRWVGEQIFE